MRNEQTAIILLATRSSLTPQPLAPQTVRKIDAAAVRARAKLVGKGANAEAQLRPNSSSLLDVTPVKHRATGTDPVVVKSKSEVRQGARCRPRTAPGGPASFFHSNPRLLHGVLLFFSSHVECLRFPAHSAHSTLHGHRRRSRSSRRCSRHRPRQRSSSLRWRRWAPRAMPETKRAASAWSQIRARCVSRMAPLRMVLAFSGRQPCPCPRPARCPCPRPARCPIALPRLSLAAGGGAVQHYHRAKHGGLV